MKIFTRPAAIVAFAVLTGLSVCCGCDGTTETTEDTPQPKSIELFVANELNQSILVIDASGNLLRTIIIPELHGGIVVDSVNKELFVVEKAGTEVGVYPTYAAGNPQPLRTLYSPYGTRNANVAAIAVDIPNNEMIMMACFCRYDVLFINFFERTASGDAAPLRSISPDFQFHFARALIVDSINKEIFVAAPTEEETTIYPSTACCIAVFPTTVGGYNMAPIRTISGSATGLKAVTAMALDTIENELFVADEENNSVLVYPRNAVGNVSPLRIISGNSTGLSAPSAIAVDTGNDVIYVSNYQSDAITVYPRKANGDITPLKVFTRPQLDIRGPTGLALAFQ